MQSESVYSCIKRIMINISLCQKRQQLTSLIAQDINQNNLSMDVVCIRAPNLSELIIW